MGLNKKAITILVIIAIILASFAIVVHVFDLNEKVPTNSDKNTIESSGGKVGIQILPPAVEDKGSENADSG